MLLTTISVVARSKLKKLEKLLRCPYFTQRDSFNSVLTHQRVFSCMDPPELVRLSPLELLQTELMPVSSVFSVVSLSKGMSVKVLVWSVSSSKWLEPRNQRSSSLMKSIQSVVLVQVKVPVIINVLCLKSLISWMVSNLVATLKF